MAFKLCKNEFCSIRSWSKYCVANLGIYYPKFCSNSNVVCMGLLKKGIVHFAKMSFVVLSPVFCFCFYVQSRCQPPNLLPRWPDGFSLPHRCQCYKYSLNRFYSFCSRTFLSMENVTIKVSKIRAMQVLKWLKRP